MLLTLLACGWLSDDRLARRHDQDQDGFVLGADCDDRSPDVQTLEDYGRAVATVECGDALQLTFGSGNPSDDVIGLGGEPVVPPCDDPLTDRYLPPLPNQILHRVQVPEASQVLVRLVSEGVWNDAQPADGVVLLPASPLLANRGAACGVDRCVVGSPLFTEASYDRQVEAESGLPFEAEVHFYAQANEPWYIVASGGNGTATLEVHCDGQDTGTTD